MRRIKHYLPSRPVVAAIVVSLLVGGIGSATAASLITGKQIKNGSLQYNDLSKKARKKLRGTRGRTGKIGATGVAGAAGATGAPGTALAYAKVISTAAADTVDASQSKGVTDANVSDFGTGGTCISGLPFTPKNIVATLANFGAGEINAGVAPDVGACPAGTQARIQTYNSGGTATDDISFVILIN